jgi:hypothetical protein
VVLSCVLSRSRMKSLAMAGGDQAGALNSELSRNAILKPREHLTDLRSEQQWLLKRPKCGRLSDNARMPEPPYSKQCADSTFLYVRVFTYLRFVCCY